MRLIKPQAVKQICWINLVASILLGILAAMIWNDYPIDDKEAGEHLVSGYFCAFLSAMCWVAFSVCFAIESRKPE